MIAYVFWHWKRASGDAAEYERVQQAFHRALAGAPPQGFHWSQSFACAGCAWAADGGDAYEDRYLVDDFTALETLERAAVSASRQGPHDAAAALAGGGAAGVYELKLGAPMRTPHHAAWFSKPPGVSYAALWELLRPSVERARASVWMRKMVLGPTSEFCIYSAEGLAMAAPIEPLNIALRPIWPA